VSATARPLTGGGLALLLAAIGCLLASVLLPLAAAAGGLLIAVAGLIRGSGWGRRWAAILVVGALAVAVSASVLLLSIDVNVGR
jgi:hypothetical protein